MFPMAYGVLPACSPQLHRPLCGLRVLFAFFAFFAGCRGFQFLFSGPASENFLQRLRGTRAHQISRSCRVGSRKEDLLQLSILLGQADG